MSNIQSYDAGVAQVFAGKDFDWILDGDIQTATGATLTGLQSGAMALHPASYTFPALPTGVSAYLVTGATALSSLAHSGIIGALVHFGSLNISTNVYTADASMPSLTEGNNSNQTYSSVIGIATTALNSAPGSLSITYNANDGTTGNVTTATALTASALINTAGIIMLNTASGHWGVSAVTSAVRTGGTTPTGTIDFYGIAKPLGILSLGDVAVSSPTQVGFFAKNPMRYAPGDVLGLFGLGVSAVRRTNVCLRILGDT